MTKRLSQQDWIAFGLTTLARDGVDALKADILARKLGVSRGSFYWHFSDLSNYHALLIEAWRQIATEAIIADLEQLQSPEERLEVLLRRGLGHNNVLEVRMRTWADNKTEAAKAIRDIDRRRRDYMKRMLMEAGVPEMLAGTRSQLLYWIYLGAALNRSKLSGDTLDQIIRELKQIGLGSAPVPKFTMVPSSDAAARTGESRRNER
jgi:AcrR family transcriptional regulator